MKRPPLVWQGMGLQYVAAIPKLSVVNRTFLVTLTFLVCGGCQMDNRFSKLQTGMTKAQVMAIVAKRPTGDKIQDGTETLQWETGSHYAKFKNGRLIDYGTE
jgi:hypothetical protein